MGKTHFLAYFFINAKFKKNKKCIIFRKGSRLKPFNKHLIAFIVNPLQLSSPNAICLNWSFINDKNSFKAIEVEPWQWVITYRCGAPCSSKTTRRLCLSVPPLKCGHFFCLETVLSKKLCLSRSLVCVVYFVGKCVISSQRHF